MESVFGVRRKKDDSWDYLIDPANKIAYIRLTSFTRKTDRRPDQGVTSLTEQGIKGLVLDLRFNPGGLLASASRGLRPVHRRRLDRDHPAAGRTGREQRVRRARRQLSSNSRWSAWSTA